MREDLDSLIELTTWPGKKSLFDSVEGKVKAALTRAYNKEVNPYSYSVTSAVKKSKAVMATDDAYGDDKEAASSSDEEQEPTVDNDVLIKAKKRPAAASSATSSKAKPTTSKPTTSRGKAKGK